MCKILFESFVSWDDHRSIYRSVANIAVDIPPFLLKLYTEKLYSKSLERNVVCTSIITFSHMMLSDIKIKHGSLQSDWTSATS